MGYVPEQNIIIEAAEQSKSWIPAIAAGITALGLIFATWLGLRKKK